MRATAHATDVRVRQACVQAAHAIVRYEAAEEADSQRLDRLQHEKSLETEKR